MDKASDCGVGGPWVESTLGHNVFFCFYAIRKEKPRNSNTGNTVSMINYERKTYTNPILIMMPKFQILHFPGPEMARLPKNLN